MTASEMKGARPRLAGGVRYFVLPNGFLRRPEQLLLPSNDTRVLWIAGLSYSSEHLSDGFIPSGAIPLICAEAHATPSEIAELERAGLWERRGDGWQIARYLEEQMSRARLEEKRGQVRERKARLTQGTRSERVPDRVPQPSRNAIGTQPETRPVGMTEIDVEREVDREPERNRIAAANASPAAAAPNHDDHARLCRLWEDATGESPSRRTHDNIRKELAAGTPAWWLGLAFNELADNLGVVKHRWPYVSAILSRMRDDADCGPVPDHDDDFEARKRRFLGGPLGWVVRHGSERSELPEPQHVGADESKQSLKESVSVWDQPQSEQLGLFGSPAAISPAPMGGEGVSTDVGAEREGAPGGGARNSMLTPTHEQ